MESPLERFNISEKGVSTMISKHEISRKKLETLGCLVAVFLVVAVAVLLATSWAGKALAQGNILGERGSLKGEIVAIDHADNLKR